MFTQTGPGGRVLAVEDEPRLAALLRLELSQRGLEVWVAADGREGLTLARRGGWLVILLDLMLPGLPGLEVCRRIRAGAFGPEPSPGEAAGEAPGPGAATTGVPIIILTARADLQDRVAGLDAGADDYVSKPFHIEEVLARMRAVLRRRGEGFDHALRVGDLRLDRRARTVCRGGADVSLTRREFDLLAFLMENSPWVMTRDVLLERVWGYAYSGTSNIVDVMIRQLRAKVDRAHGAPLIHTVRGVGYVLRQDPP